MPPGPTSFCAVEDCAEPDAWDELLSHVSCLQGIDIRRRQRFSLMSAVIQVQDLLKKFGAFTAVDGISFAVYAGEIFGFLGPNGAGKTTTINMLATLLKPTSGSVVLAGHDVLREPNQVRQAIGMVFQDPSLDDRLTAEENLIFHAMLYNIPRKLRGERISQVLDIVGLADRRQ